MFDENTLGFFTVGLAAWQAEQLSCTVLRPSCAQNWLGVGIVLLVVAYHYLIADPSASA